MAGSRQKRAIKIGQLPKRAWALEKQLSAVGSAGPTSMGSRSTEVVGGEAEPVWGVRKEQAPRIPKCRRLVDGLLFRQATGA